MIKYLLNELSRAGQENIWLSAMTSSPVNIFPSGPPTQSITTEE